MLIGAALIELALPDADSIKARRRVVRAVKDRVRQRFNVSVADLGDPDDRHRVSVGCVVVGVDPRHLHRRLEKVVRFVEGLGVAEMVEDDIMVVRLDEVEEVDLSGLEDEPFDWEDE
jgi:uncharacterized protein YlxP (DUF503 family)